MLEIWKMYYPINSDFEYSVSSLGRVFNPRTKRQTGNYKNAGYKCVPYPTNILKGQRLNKRAGKYKSSMFYVHKAVAALFLEKVEGKPYLHLIDLDKGNPRLDNLEYADSEKNYTRRMKTFVSSYDVNSDQADRVMKGKLKKGVVYVLTDSQVRLIRRQNLPPTKMARHIGCSYRTVWEVRTGRTYRHVL